MPRKQTHIARKFFKYNSIRDENSCEISNCDKRVKGNHAGNLLKHLEVYHEKEFIQVTKVTVGVKRKLPSDGTDDNNI